MGTKRQLHSQSLADQVYELLKQDLIHLRYSPGSRIKIEDIENELNISRIPIRDALQKLVEKGLVIARPRVGFFAAKLTVNDIEDLFRVRILFENFALSSGFNNIDRNLLMSMEKRYEKLLTIDTFSDKDKNTLFDLENQFHWDVIIGSGNSPIINKFYGDIRLKINLASQLSFRLKDDISEHLRIIQAILTNDQHNALKLLNLHLTLVERDLINALAENGK